LHKKGASVAYSDPHVPLFPQRHARHVALHSTHLSGESIASYDLVLLATNHSAFDYQMIQQHARVIVDTRGVYPHTLENVVRS